LPDFLREFENGYFVGRLLRNKGSEIRKKMLLMNIPTKI
jgi:hypothetical protein